jgi:hypothetical protein
MIVGGVLRMLMAQLKGRTNWTLRAFFETSQKLGQDWRS